MPTVIEYLESFNRKERFFLIGKALGNVSFRLDRDFRKRLDDKFGLEIPEDAFAAMDYHLDWIGASLFLAEDTGRESQVHPNVAGFIAGNSEDVDLIVAFTDSGITHLIMIEAKVETSLTNKQPLSKALRLNRIFGPDGDAVPDAVPHFGLMSPRFPKRLKTDQWPRWMLSSSGSPAWLELSVPPGRRKVTRTDARGKPAKAAGYFAVTAPERSQNAPRANEARGARNFDGKLALDETLAHCRLRPDIEVGHRGGEEDLINSGIGYAERKRWKWRNPKTNSGPTVRKNWIAAKRFIGLIAEMRE